MFTGAHGPDPPLYTTTITVSSDKIMECLNQRHECGTLTGNEILSYLVPDADLHTNFQNQTEFIST